MREHVIALGEAPTLLVASAAPAVAAERGTVLVLHGLGASKEAQRVEAYSLADRGYLAVVPDAVGHGARRYPDFEARFAPGRWDRSYPEVVRASAAEVPALREGLAARGLIRPGRLGAVGISMGGAVLFGALAAGVRFDAAATIVASPRWQEGPDSPHEHPERLFPVPLLLQTAGADANVPPGEARSFYEALRPYYGEAPERLRYVEHAGEKHFFTEAGWKTLWSGVLEWLDRFLRAPDDPAGVTLPPPDGSA